LIVEARFRSSESGPPHSNGRATAIGTPTGDGILSSPPFFCELEESSREGDGSTWRGPVQLGGITLGNRKLGAGRSAQWKNPTRTEQRRTISSRRMRIWPAPGGRGEADIQRPQQLKEQHHVGTGPSQGPGVAKDSAKTGASNSTKTPYEIPVTGVETAGRSARQCARRSRQSATVRRMSKKQLQGGALGSSLGQLQVRMFFCFFFFEPKNARA